VLKLTLSLFQSIRSRESLDALGAIGQHHQQLPQALVAWLCFAAHKLILLLHFPVEEEDHCKCLRENATRGCGEYAGRQCAGCRTLNQPFSGQ
jgi:hypothetical protein